MLIRVLGCSQNLKQDIEMSEPEYNQENIEKLSETLVEAMDMEEVTGAAEAWLTHVYSNNPSIFREDWENAKENGDIS